MVQIALWVIGLGLLVGLGIDPAWRNIKKIRSELPALRSEAATVKALSDEARRLTALNKAAAPIDSTQLRGNTEQSIERVGLKSFAVVSGNSSAGGSSNNTELQISFKGAPFATVLDWVNLVPRELSVRIKSAKFERLGGAGKVNAEIVFDSAGTNLGSNR